MIKLRCKNKNLLSILGYTLMIGNSITLYLTFLAAYFNGGQVIITINTYNEANIEFILLPSVLIIGIYGLAKLIKRSVI